MEEKKTFLQQLKEFVLGYEDKETTLEETPLVELEEAVKLEEMQLEDGTVISAVAFAEGESVFAVNPETEEKIPLPIGEFPLMDGSVLVVVDEGIIASIGAPAEASPEENMETEFVTKADFDAAITEIKSMLSKEVEAKEELSKVNSELQEKVDNIPDAKTIKTIPVEMKIETPKNRKERIYQLMQNQN